MIIEYVRYELAADQGDAFLRAYAEAGLALDRNDHCLAWEVSQCVEEQGSWVVRLEWDSLQGHEEGFRQSEDFAGFLAAVRPFYGAIREMRHYERRAGGSSTAL